MKTLFMGSLTCAASLTFLKAELIWESKEVEFQAEKPSLEIPVFYTCENKGQNPVSIVSVETSCNCLEVQAGSEPVAPLESRTVAVVFRPGMRHGPQKVDFKLKTSGDKAYQLSLKGVVPAPLILDPPVLVWNVQEGLEPRTFTAKLADSIEAKISEIYSMDENFLTSSQEVDGFIRVKVSPQRGDVKRLARVAIVTETEGQEKRSYFLFMRIADRDPNKTLSPQLKNALYWPEELETPSRKFLKNQNGALQKGNELLLESAAGSFLEILSTQNASKASR